MLSVVSVTPSGLAFTRRDVGNAVGLAGTPSLAGVYTVNLVLRQPGRVDTREFTVTATCRTGHTQQPDRSCEAPAPVVCTVSLGRGWVSSGTLVGSGSWEGGCVLPEGRMGRGGVFYAKHFMFSLLFDAVVTIDLTSSDENSYLFLLGGFGAHGDEVDRDNDSGTGRNSKLANLSLDAGAYTVSASTYHSERTGSFEVSLDAVLPLTITGLDYSYSATVDEDFRVDFTYEPDAAELEVVWHTSGLDPTVEENPAGEVTITDTITSAGIYAVLLAFAQAGHTDYEIFTITAECPTNHAESPSGDRSCVPVETVPAGCAVTSLGGGATWWGRVGATALYSSYGSGAPAACTSLSESNRAAYYSFTVPHNTPAAMLGRVSLEPVLTAVSRPGATPPPLVGNGGSPSVTLWKYLLSGGHPTMVRSRVQRVAADTAGQGADPVLTHVLTGGDYLVEVAPTGATSGGSYELGVWLPTPHKVHNDVKKLGNTGLNGTGMTLHQFLEARGSLAKSSGGGNFDPPSADYPWLPFTSDGCSIPLTVDQLEDHANFHGGSVPFIYACFRHDFNWRNLHRVKHHLRHDIGGVWTGTILHEANGRLGEDLYVLCNANQHGSGQTSVHYTWTLSLIGVDDCESAARTIKFVVGLVPFLLIDYTH